MSPARMALQTSAARSNAGTRMRQRRPILEPGGVDGGMQLEQIGERGEARARVQVLGVQLELAEERGQDVRGQGLVVLQAHRGAETALAQLSSMLASTSAGRSRIVSRASRVTRMAWAERIV